MECPDLDFNGLPGSGYFNSRRALHLAVFARLSTSFDSLSGCAAQLLTEQQNFDGIDDFD